MRDHYFHLNDFPKNRTFILLNKIFHKRLFKYIDKTYSFKELRKKFEGNLNYSTYKKWKYRTKKRNSKFPRFIPLTFIIKISKILGKKCDINEIERNVIAYKGPSSSSIIWQPNLPLPEDYRLLKIMAHLMGDGHVGGGFGTKLPKGKNHSNYGNFNRCLLETFIKDLQVFGKVKVSKQYKHGYLVFPNLIGYIIEHIYKVKTGTFESKIPARLYKLPRRLVAKFIRAFFDDESHVFDSSIEVYSANRRLLLGLLNLMKYKFPKLRISKLKTNEKACSRVKRTKYSFSVLNESLKSFKRNIGFDHPNKSSDIDFNIVRKKLKDKPSKNPKGFIKNLLNNQKLTAKQISKIMFIRHDGVLKHLNELEKLNEVKVVEKGKHNENIWTSIR